MNFVFVCEPSGALWKAAGHMVQRGAACAGSGSLKKQEPTPFIGAARSLLALIHLAFPKQQTQ
jgi:hypothetical protein